MIYSNRKLNTMQFAFIFLEKKSIFWIFKYFDVLLLSDFYYTSASLEHRWSANSPPFVAN